MFKKTKTLFFLSFLSLFVMATEQADKNFVKIGGALRYNAVYENYELSNDALDAYVKADTWFLNADAHLNGFDMSMQYRFYPESQAHFMHHGYIGYAINDNLYARLGVFQKPFGIADFASHSWWFQIPYYLGLEDTHNTGIGFKQTWNDFIVEAAYFRQAAPKGSISDNTLDNAVGNGRYSYAVVPTTGYANGVLTNASVRELNQFNARARYEIVPGVEFGLSGQLGSIYNSALNQSDWGFTWAAHSLINIGNLNFKAEVIDYHYNAVDNAGNKLDILQMAAYGAAYDVATQGMIYVVGLAYKIPINTKLINSIQPYIDYSVVDKKNSDYFNTEHLIPGVLITSGPIYTYIDYALGKNQPWLTSNFGEGLGAGNANARWNSRFNINIGYYF